MSATPSPESVIRERLEAAKIRVDSEQVDRLAAYWSLLAHWNAAINLTSLQLDPPVAAAVDRLIVEALASVPFIKSITGSWYDLGSGGGSPAIPMKIAMPAWKLTMVESRARKAAFLREAGRELKLSQVEVRSDRVEDVASNPLSAGSADLVTTRAVALDATFGQSVASLLRRDGVFFYFGAREDRPSTASVQPLEITAKHDLAGGGRLWMFHVER